MKCRITMWKTQRKKMPPFPTRKTMDAVHQRHPYAVFGRTKERLKRVSRTPWYVYSFPVVLFVLIFLPASATHERAPSKRV